MSLLEQLQQKRKALRTTTTTVTTATGDRYLESNSEKPVKLLQKSYGFVVDIKPDTVPACIETDFLYLGSQDAVSIENVQNYRITHVLSVGIETPNVDLLTAVHSKYIPCLDLPETNLFNDVIPKALDFITTAKSLNGRVLVHCNAGVSRSASVVIAYLMLKSNLTYQQAYDSVKAQRACIQPNAGFREQLKTYKI